MSKQSAWKKFRLACGRFGRKTGDAVSIQKMKLDISEIRDDREKDYAALGRLCYKDLKTAGGLDGEIAELVTAIHEKNLKIRELKEEIATVQNKRYCPKCNTLMDANVHFCSHCGFSLTCPEVLQAIEESKDELAMPAAEPVSDEPEEAIEETVDEAAQPEETAEEQPAEESTTEEEKC